MAIRKIAGAACLILVGALLLSAGCTGTGGSNHIQGANKPGEKITISGAFALYPMMVKWAEEYQKINPNVRIEVSAGGAGKGMTDALSGMVDIGMISRDITNEEMSKGAVWVAVTKDAVVPTINEKNPVKADLDAHGIKKSAFRAIFVNGTVSMWGQVVNRSDVKDTIQVYTRSDACGAADTWAKYLNSKFSQDNLMGVGIFGDPGIADAVRNDPLGIGYNNIGFAYDPTTGKPVAGLAIVPIDINENGVIDENERFYSTRDEILSAIDAGKYPSPPARDLNLVVKDKFSGPTKEFIRWILTDGQKYVPEAGFIPLTKEKINAQLIKLNT